MKKILFLTTIFLTLCGSLSAQADRFSYQAVVRNPQGQPLLNQPVSFRFSIRQGSSNGTLAYQETHADQTNDFGLITLQIGAGNSSGSLTDVNWANGPYFLHVETDPNGGSAYEDLGATELLSVPYALHAETANQIDDADADPNNELQTLTLTGNTLTISQGNSISLPDNSIAPESSAKAWVHFPIVGTPSLSFDAYNVTSTSVSSTGVRIVSFPPGLFSPATHPAMVCQIRNDLAPGFCVVTSGASPSQVTVRTYDANGNLANKEFSLVVFGR